MNYDMEIDEIDENSQNRTTDESFSQQGNSVDLEGLISGLRQETRPRREAFEGYNKSGREADIKRLRQIWVAERAAPELLAFESGLLDRIMERVRAQVSKLESVNWPLELTNRCDISKKRRSACKWAMIHN